LRNPPSGFAILPSDVDSVKPNRNHFPTVLPETNCPNRRARRSLRCQQGRGSLPRTHDPRQRAPIALAERRAARYVLVPCLGLPAARACLTAQVGRAIVNFQHAIEGNRDCGIQIWRTARSGLG
jgi:hypothetical protein